MSRPEEGPGGAIRLLVGDEHGQLKVVTWKDRSSLSGDPSVERWLKAPLDRSRAVSALATTVLAASVSGFDSDPSSAVSAPPPSRALVAVGRKDGSVEILDALSGAPIGNVLASEGQLDEADESKAETQDRVVQSAKHAGRTAGGRSEQERDDDEVVGVFFLRNRGGAAAAGDRSPLSSSEPSPPSSSHSLSLLRVTRGGLATVFPLCPRTGVRLSASGAAAKGARGGSGSRLASAHPARSFATTPSVCAADVDPSHRFLLVGSNGAEPRVYWLVDREGQSRVGKECGKKKGEEKTAVKHASAKNAITNGAKNGTRAPSSSSSSSLVSSLFGTVAFQARGPGANKFRLVETPWINAVAFSKISHLASAPLVGPPDVAPTPGAKAGNVAEPSPVPPFAVATGKGHRVRLYRPSSGRKPRTDEPVGEARATAVACEPRSGRLWVADGLGLVAEVRRTDGKLGTVLKGPRGSIRSIAFGGDEYDSCLEDGNANNEQTGQKSATPTETSAPSATSIPAVAPSAVEATAGLAAAVGLDRFVRVWDAASRKKKAQAYLKTHLTVVTFLPSEDAFPKAEEEEEEKEERDDGEAEEHAKHVEDEGSEDEDEDEGSDDGSEESGSDDASDESGSEEESDDGSEDESLEEGDSDSASSEDDEEPAPSPPRKRTTAAPRSAHAASKKRKGA